MVLTIPISPIVVQRPEEEPSEHNKFKDGGEWFKQMNRWITLNYYNTYSVQNAYNTPSSNAGIVNSNGTNVNTIGSRSIVDEMIDNNSYFFGSQDNRIFNYMTMGIGGNPLPNIWVKGQEIRQLAGHIEGKGLQLLAPIEDNISADSISENTLLKRQEIMDKIDLGAKIGAKLNDLAGGDLQYNPTGEVDYSDPTSIKEAKKNVRSQYENTATVIARSVYYQNDLKQCFHDSILDTVINNLCGIEFFECEGRLDKRYIPGYNCIFDFSTWGQYGEGSTLGGYIIPMRLEEILTEYPDIDPAWRDEITEAIDLKGDPKLSAQFCEYYNQPFQNVKWWYNSEKWITKSVVYFLAKRDLRHQKKTNQYGGKKVQKIDDYKTYQVPTGAKDKNGNPEFVSKKGYDIKGDSSIWAVHKAVLIGNKYLVEYGYEPYQVRPFGDKQKPEIPIKFFCQGKLAGYVKPIVSRLKQKQDELDAVRYRIREYTAQDLGVNRFIRGGKLGEGVELTSIISDLKSWHMTVIPETGDEGSDRLGIKDLIHTEDMSNHAYISEYLTLKRDIENEMKAIVNLTDVALGTQDATIGKGVQQETIARSELSGLSLYESLQEYWRRCIQYAANKAKLIMLDAQTENVILPINNKEIKILSLTKDFRFEDLMVYISENDNVHVQDMQLLRQALVSYSINPVPAGAEAILNIMKILRFKSFGEGIALLEDYVETQKAEQQKLAFQANATQQQQDAFKLQSAQIAQQQAEIAKLITDLAKIQLTGAWNLKEIEAKAGVDNQAKLSDFYIEQINQIVSQQLAAAGQPQGAPSPDNQNQPQA